MFDYDPKNIYLSFPAMISLLVFSFQISCQLRLTNQVNHLATVLNASVGGNEGANAFYNRLNSRFSQCLEEERKGIEREIRSVFTTMVGVIIDCPQKDLFSTL